MGGSTSSGMYYGNDYFFSNSPIAMGLAGPYSASLEDQFMAPPMMKQTAWSVAAPLPYERCHMFKRSFNLCAANEYTYDSEKNRCAIEKEDWYNCILHGKENRFLTIWSNVHRTEAGERQYASFMNNWEKSMYDKDSGDVLARAENIQKMYKERGLKGPKWQGDYE